MLVALETTKWEGDYPNHIYYLNKSRDKMFGYVRFGTSDPYWFKNPIGFEARGRKFVILEEQPDPVKNQPAESWRVPGSNGAVWTVTREDGQFSCDCPAARFRHHECKHIQQVRSGL